MEQNNKGKNIAMMILKIVLILGAGVLYIASPIDVIPDAVSAAAPPVGHLDDICAGVGSIVGSIVSMVTDIRKIKSE